MQKDVNTVEIKKQIEDNSLKRYVLSVVSWQESLVIENLRERTTKQWLSLDIVDYICPMINETSMKKWEKIIKQKKLYPWYVFIKSKMNDKIWYVVRNTPWVRLIVWAETRPVPLTDQEYNSMMEQILKSQERSELVMPYKKNDVVLLKTWDFKWMKWSIRAVSYTHLTLPTNREV